MVTQMKTPGVYIVEKNAFPNSVVAVPTAVPAFIGYTAMAERSGKSLLNKPTRISSLAEFISYFGGAPKAQFSLTAAAGAGAGGAKPAAKKKAAAPAAGAAAPAPEADINFRGAGYNLQQETGKFCFLTAFDFYENGGGPCYIVSVGTYDSPDAIVESDKLQSGIDPLIREDEPTMVVVPDAVNLAEADCYKLQQAMLMHCGGKMRSRIALLDIYNGIQKRTFDDDDVITRFRNGVGINFLDFGTAYYPWVETTIVQDSDLNYQNIRSEDLPTLQGLIRSELGVPDKPASDTNLKTRGIIDTINNITATGDDVDVKSLNQALVVLSPLFNAILTEIRAKLNVLPPSSAMAGLYTMVDNTRGVWKAPANVSVNTAIKPAVNITHDDQEDLNVTPLGKSINAIRTFVGEGVLVWGARTLDGNSQDWRYVNVRRTMIMLEQSVKNAAKAYVFEPNDSNTWIAVKSMLNNFLTNMWKQGALVGAKPNEAFDVQVGLGSTMTPNDILDGIMRVTVKVAISRPAEFIEITFQQQMQKS